MKSTVLSLLWLGAFAGLIVAIAWALSLTTAPRAEPPGLTADRRQFAAREADARRLVAEGKITPAPSAPCDAPLGEPAQPRTMATESTFTQP